MHMSYSRLQTLLHNEQWTHLSLTVDVGRSRSWASCAVTALRYRDGMKEARLLWRGAVDRPSACDSLTPGEWLELALEAARAAFRES